LNWQLSAYNSALRSLSSGKTLEKKLEHSKWFCSSQGPCEGEVGGL